MGAWCEMKWEWFNTSRHLISNSMIRKLFLSGLGLMIGWCLKAQVVVTLQLPPLGLTIKPQLWNLSVINSTGAPINAQLQMIMTDAATNQTVLTGISPQFLLPAGLKVITGNDVAPVSYTTGAGYSIDPGANGFLPVGVFNVCYTLTKWTNDISEQLAEECITAEIEPVSPPQLVQPADSEQVSIPRPFFTWLPPQPYNAFTNLQYDWMLVEVQTMQSAADAMQQNIPLLTQPNVAITSLQYPLSMPALETGKLYAWRVTAKNNGMAVANSEIWSFSIGPNQADTLRGKTKGYYTALKREPDASYIICNGILHYSYLHEINSNSVTLKITDISKPDRKQLPLDSNTCFVNYGLNYLDMDVSDVSGIIDRHMYLLELVNDRQEHWYLKFEYRKPVE
jgi:hypothetical protein